MDAPRPVPLGDDGRLGALDALRGLALCGILLANMRLYPRGAAGFALEPARPAAALDRWASWTLQWLVEGKAWLLLAMLFGAGFALMQRRSGDWSGRLWWRRAAVLGAIGLGHALLLWPGDVLHVYALAALLLWPMRRVSPGAQLAVGACGLLGIGLLSLLVAVLAGAAGDAAVFAANADHGAAAAADRIYATGTYAEATAQRWRDLGVVFAYDLGGVPMAWCAFLVGAGAAGAGWLERWPAARWWRVAVPSLVAGLGVSLVAVVIGARAALTDVDGTLMMSSLQLLGSLPLAIGYAAGVLALMEGTLGRWLQFAMPAGRMALTLYLAQSLLCVLLFHGYGLGLAGRVDVAAQCLLAFAILALQFAAARWWLARWRHGPMEWVWRTATYGRPPRMVRDA